VKFNEKSQCYDGSPLVENDLFSVELIDRIVSEMSNGKAPGLDELTSENLKFSHPILITILSKLFNVFLLQGYIPHDFCKSYTVPIPKVDVRTRALTVNDFRGISISPVISKVFELAIANRFYRFFETSDRQFGFKKSIGCRHAIYSLRNIIDYFISNKTTVNICSIDLSKAFDKTNHYVLLLKLMERKLPVQLINIFEQWFCCSQTSIKWGNCFSYFFPLKAGVRHGGVLSPIYFSIYMDSLIDKISSSKYGCYISCINFSIIMYADDIVLLAPTVTGLQMLLLACENELNSLDMRLNTKKSVCLRFGTAFDALCAPMVTCNNITIQWTHSFRYLGVYFVTGRSLRCSFDEAKCKYYRAFNAILSKIGRNASEEVSLSLIRAKCIPCLLYAVECCPLLSRDKHSLEFTVTRSLMKLFRTGSPAIVMDCQIFFKLLPVTYLIDLYTAKFLQQVLTSENFLCQCFSHVAKKSLIDICTRYGSVASLSDLRACVESRFFPA
jgi:hypothetical protein